MARGIRNKKRKANNRIKREKVGKAENRRAEAISRRMDEIRGVNPAAMQGNFFLSISRFFDRILTPSLEDTLVPLSEIQDGAFKGQLQETIKITMDIDTSAIGQPTAVPTGAVTKPGDKRRKDRSAKKQTA